MPDSTCSIDGCDSPQVTRGWCNKHYTRWKRHGDPLASKYRMDGRPRCAMEDCDRLARGSDGLCGKHYARANRARNRARDAAYRKQYRARPGQRERELAAGRDWKARHADHVAAYTAQYRRENPDVVKAMKARRRALERGVSVRDLTAAQWREIKAAFDNRCAYCGERFERLTQDHVVPLSKGGAHTASNVVPACRPCNSRKQDGPAPPFHPIFRVE